MTDRRKTVDEPGTETFVWHPEYAGKTFESVRRQLEDDIGRDQRAYELALEQAEREEHDAFTAVRELEKRWSDYDFGWTEIPPMVLADRILAFERAREERQHLISWQDWKAVSTPTVENDAMAEHKPDWRENLTDEQRRRIASAASIFIIFAFIAGCALVYMLIR